MRVFERDIDNENEGRQERLRFWLTIVLGAVLTGIVGALVLLLSRANDSYDRSLGWQAHSLEIISQTRSLDAALARAEAALGRFAVGLQKEDGRVYQQQWGLSQQYLTLLQRNVRDNPKQDALVKQLTAELNIRGEQLGDAALSANYRQTVAAISKYNAAGHDNALLRIDRLLSELIRNERTILAERNRVASADRASLNQAILLFSLLGAAAAVIAIAATVSLVRAESERRAARREQWAESDRAMQLEAAVDARTAELEQANVALRSEMSEREAAEAQLRQAQKMEAVGQLTGGIAHDFNNLLTVISGNIDLARRALAGDAPAAERAVRLLANAEEGAARAAALTQRLLAFSRRQPLSPEPTGLAGLVAGVMPLLTNALGPSVAVKVEVADDLWPVLVDRNQLENSLLNLAVNARDAMVGEGDIAHGEFVIRAANQSIGAGGVLPAGDYVRLGVADTGCGMDPATAARVFEPFFTTKEQGKGTGLGLSMVYGFVRQSGGQVTVETVPGRGTTFCLWLPRSARTPLPLARRGEASAPAARGGTVLVVEDDPAVRAYSAELFADLGFEVVEAGDAPAALAVLEARSGEIDLLFTDIVMPGMSGRALAQAARDRWPELKILFTTGYAREAAPEESGMLTVAKPFNAATLATRVEAAMAG